MSIATMQTDTAKTPLSRWTVGLGLVAGPSIVLVVGLLALYSGDPLDRFKVVEVLNDALMPRYAAIYHYEHADSSSSVTAAWISSGKPPAVGSTSRPRGGPALVWPRQRSLRMRWEKDNPRLIVEVDGAVDIRSGEQFASCYFDQEESQSSICADPKRIEVRSIKTGSMLPSPHRG